MAQTTSSSTGTIGVKATIGSCGWAQLSSPRGDWAAVARDVRLHNASSTPRSVILRIDFLDADGLRVGSSGFGSLSAIPANGSLIVGDAIADYSFPMKKTGAVRCVPVIVAK